MNYEENWSVLADLLTEVKKKGEKTPRWVMNDLRSAKVMIQILKANATYNETTLKLENLLRNIESYIIFTAQEKFGTTFADNWLKKLEKAKKTESKEQKETKSKFIPGLPKNQSWVRIQTSQDLPLKKVKSLAKEHSLSSTTQHENYVLVYGTEKNMKSFLKTMADQHRGARKTQKDTNLQTK